jgi:hypothetical protein
MGQRGRSRLRLLAAMAGLMCAAAFASSARSEEPKLSISGYDPVAYFTDGKPVPGEAEFEQLWHRLRWRFASEAHREMFAKDPDHYAPQYDGYCAMGASGEDVAHKDTVDPNAWSIVDGKLYLVHNEYWLQVWQEKAADHIKQANRDWEIVKNLVGPEIVGAPCAASPPTTKLALRDGGHMVAVAGQFARDAAGNVIGKGDLGRRSSRLARMSMRASARAVPASKTSSSPSATSNSPKNSTNTPICASVTSGRLHRRARLSRCRNRSTPICWCRSRPSPRPSELAKKVQGGGLFAR